MSDETRGYSIRRRREALGIFADREFERATDRVGFRVPRASIAKAEAGVASDQIYSRLEMALDRLEEETGQNDAEPESRHVTFRISGNFGVDVIVDGPVENIAELEASVEKLIGKLRPEG